MAPPEGKTRACEQALRPSGVYTSALVRARLLWSLEGSKVQSKVERKLKDGKMRPDWMRAGGGGSETLSRVIFQRVCERQADGLFPVQGAERCSHWTGLQFPPLLHWDPVRSGPLSPRMSGLFGSNLCLAVHEIKPHR